MSAPRDRRVVDASVAVKWLIPEEGSDAAGELLSHDLHAPTLLRIEVGNVLRTLSTRGVLTDDRAREAFDLVLDAPVTWHEPDPALLRNSLEMAMTLKHPIYDCIYLALAIGLGSALVTADRRFHGAVSAKAELDGLVNLLGATLRMRP